MTSIHDEWSLRALSERYGFAVDARDMDALATLFWPDASILTHSVDHPEEIVGHLEGVAAIRGIGQRMNDRYDTTFHFVGNAAYQVADDEATGTVNCVAHHLRRKDDQITDYVMFIRYDDRYGRREGQWRFDERRLRVRWTERRALGDKTQLGPPDFSGS
jgi:hypothetical protein